MQVCFDQEELKLHDKGKKVENDRICIQSKLLTDNVVACIN